MPESTLAGTLLPQRVQLIPTGVAVEELALERLQASERPVDDIGRLPVEAGVGYRGIQPALFGLHLIDLLWQALEFPLFVE
jgi:hypothetical protein